MDLCDIFQAPNVLGLDGLELAFIEERLFLWTPEILSKAFQFSLVIFSLGKISFKGF
jgi:hypothetical protein